MRDIPDFKAGDEVTLRLNKYRTAEGVFHRRTPTGHLVFMTTEGGDQLSMRFKPDRYTPAGLTFQANAKTPYTVQPVFAAVYWEPEAREHVRALCAGFKGMREAISNYVAAVRAVPDVIRNSDEALAALSAAQALVGAAEAVIVAQGRLVK
jgi:hypothetical protein